MAAQLENIVQFVAVGAGLTVVQSHGLATQQGKPLTPDLIARQTTGDFTITVTSTTVSVTNNGASATNVDVWVRSHHTFERCFGGDQNTTLPVQPFELGGPGSGVTTTLQQAYTNGAAGSSQDITLSAANGPIRLIAESTLTTTLTISDVGVGTTQRSGLDLTNPTAATVGAQKFSPMLVLRGSGWKTNAVAGPQDVEFAAQAQALQDAAAPVDFFNILSRVNGSAGTWRSVLTLSQVAFNGGAYSTIGTWTSTNNANQGGITVAVNMTSGNGAAGLGTGYYWAATNGSGVAEGIAHARATMTVATSGAITSDLIFNVRGGGAAYTVDAMRIIGNATNQFAIVIGSSSNVDPLAGVSKFKAVDGTMTMSFRDSATGQGYLLLNSSTNSITGLVGYTETASGWNTGSWSNHSMCLRTNATIRLTLDTSGNMSLAGGYFEMFEVAAPVGGAANTGRLYLVDAAGKTQLRVIFNTGVSQLIAAEP
jgi:hypothetical protein